MSSLLSLSYSLKSEYLQGIPWPMSKPLPITNSFIWLFGDIWNVEDSSIK